VEWLEEDLRFSAADCDGAGAALRRHGVVIIDDLWPAARIAKFLEDLRETYAEIFDERQGQLDQTQFVGDLRHVSPIVVGGALNCTDVLLHPVLDDLLQKPLDAGYVFESVGVIQSHPGADRQHRHRDGSPLFALPQLDRLLPAFAMTVTIPLVAMDAKSGTTAFWPGSHLMEDESQLREDAMFAPIVPPGSAVIWDYRIRHCGLANRGDRTRPLLYVTACRPFWIDSKNFKRGRDLKLLVAPEVLESLDKAGRKRFARAQLFAAGERPWNAI
jgi:hypothetical protein